MSDGNIHKENDSKSSDSQSKSSDSQSKSSDSQGEISELPKKQPVKRGRRRSSLYLQQRRKSKEQLRSSLIEAEKVEVTRGRSASMETSGFSREEQRELAWMNVRSGFVTFENALKAFGMNPEEYEFVNGRPQKKVSEPPRLGKRRSSELEGLGTTDSTLETSCLPKQIRDMEYTMEMSRREREGNKPPNLHPVRKN